MSPRNSSWGDVAHAFLAVAVAVPLAVALGVIGTAMTAPEQSLLNRQALLVVLAGFIVVVLWVGSLPQVRPVATSVARSLGAGSLPEAAPSPLWTARQRGLWWLGILALVGAFVALALLYFVPLGIGLALHPFGDDPVMRVPGGLIVDAGVGWRAAWAVPVGLGLVAVGGGCVLAAGVGLRRLAPAVLGPTLAERVARAAERERELAAANTLARDLHDTLGHTVTAMTLQVTAALRLLDVAPVRAAEHLTLAEDLGRRAQADVDAVVGTLRGRNTVASPEPSAGTQISTSPSTTSGATPASPADLGAYVRRLAADAGLALTLHADPAPTVTLSEARSATAGGVLREAVTNAARHGDGVVDVRLFPGAHADALVIEVRNRRADRATASAQRTDSPSGSRRRHGLIGLAERVRLVGGTLDAGEDPEDESLWLVRAVIPR